MRTKGVYAAVALGAAAFVAWRVVAIKTSYPVQFDVVEDFSASHAHPCNSLQGLAEQVIESPDASLGSTLTVLATGDRATADEPHRIATYPIPAIRKVAEGQGELQKQRAAILDELRTKCQSVPQASISPIFLGVKEAVADLRAHGCGITSRCTLFVDSDLEENVEPSIRERLNGRTRRAGPLPPAIKNAGIRVSFCGLAMTVRNGKAGKKWVRAAPRDAIQDDQLRRTWLHLFTDPSAVRFAPYCSSPIVP